MSDKYTIEQIEKEVEDMDILAVSLIGRGFTGAAMLRQLLDDHETMRRALERIRFDDDCPSPRVMAGIALDNLRTDKALGEVTK